MQYRGTISTLGAIWLSVRLIFAAARYGRTIELRVHGEEE